MTGLEPAVDLDWSRRFPVDAQAVLLHVKTNPRPPRVTVGMPTYRRAHTIRRALNALARQTFRDFTVIISDNAGADPATLAAVEAIAPELPEVRLIAQEENVGVLRNLRFVLGCAETEYFMWLADDDEVTDNYLEELVRLLDHDPRAVAAMGRWRRMVDPTTWEPGVQLRSTDRDRLSRVTRYVRNATDDTLYYGLHRTELLRSCRFPGYAWPNQTTLANYCYVFLYDLIWRGPVAYSDQAAWISHNYTEKQYAAATARGLKDRVTTLLRRIDVYRLYVQKTAKWEAALAPAVLLAAISGLAHDVGSAIVRIGGRALKRRAA